MSCHSGYEYFFDQQYLYSGHTLQALLQGLKSTKAESQVEAKNIYVNHAESIL